MAVTGSKPRDETVKRRSADFNLPAESSKVQMGKRDAWNDALSFEDADFFTIGYSGRDISAFIAILKAARIASLIDIRFNPVSLHKPDFSKRNLELHLAGAEIEYLHYPNLGVPRDIRSLALGALGREVIWEWYDENIVPTVADRNLHWFFNFSDHPVALMCTEIDPTSCHRHRLALALGRKGLRFFDL